MGPLFLVNWHVVNIRFRALMWAIAAVLAIVVLIASMPKPVHQQRATHAWSATHKGLKGRP